jgi:hypothetical protein
MVKRGPVHGGASFLVAVCAVGQRAYGREGSRREVGLGYGDLEFTLDKEYEFYDGHGVDAEVCKGCIFSYAGIFFDNGGLDKRLQLS